MGQSSVNAFISVVNSFGPPRLIFEPDDVEAFTGTTIELPCKGEGDPTPQVMPLLKVDSVQFIIYLLSI